jgi:glucosamine--fructose-6-phosphate aminotransferase (isomerizing)
VTSEFEREIAEQPAVIAGLIARREEVEHLAAALVAAAPRFLVIAARGSSDNAARYAVYLFGAKNRLAVALAAPSLTTLYEASPSMVGGALLGVSQSGQSPDVVAVLADARAQGALTIAVTNDAGSPLAVAAEHALGLGVGVERAVAASKTYTGQLVALAMLSAAMAGDRERWRELEALPDAVAGVVAGLGDARAAAAALVGAGHLPVLARGFNRATAFEAALKLKETAYLAAEASSWVDFLHGPIAMLGPGAPALVIAPSGRADGDADGILDRLVAAAARPIVISDRPALLARGAAALRLPIVPEWLSPVTAAVAAQQLALAAAEARGLDPDRPRGLSKITRTR